MILNLEKEVYSIENQQKELQRKMAEEMQTMILELTLVRK